jgi:hypothetical protein
MSFTSWVDERISNALTDQRIKLAVDEAVTQLTKAMEAEVEKLRGEVKADIEKLPAEIIGGVNDQLARIESSVGGLQQFLNGLPHIPFLQ